MLQGRFLLAGLIALGLLAGSCGESGPNGEFVRLKAEGTLDFRMDPGDGSEHIIPLDEEWVIDEDGSGSRTSADPKFDREFRVSDADLERLRGMLDAIELDDLEERFGAGTDDALRTTFTYDGETVVLGDRLAEVNEGEGDEQADLFMDVQMRISRLSDPGALKEINRDAKRTQSQMRRIIKRNQTCEHAQETARKLPNKPRFRDAENALFRNVEPSERPCPLPG